MVHFYSPFCNNEGTTAPPTPKAAAHTPYMHPRKFYKKTEKWVNGEIPREKRNK